MMQPGLQGTSPSYQRLIPTQTVEQRELANGLHVLVQPDFTAPVVSVQFWCATGSIHETPWLGAGISHLLEHLLFKGTPTRGNSEMAQQIQDLGGHLNAYTSFDRTVYHVDLPSDHALAAVEILGDAVFHSLIPEGEYKKEMEVIRREFAMGRDNPDSELGKRIFSTAFTRHPYRHPVIGNLDLFNQVTRADVLAYYHERYAPQNITLIVCGAVDPQAIFARAAELLEREPRRKLPDIYLPPEPPQHQRREVQYEFETHVTRLALTWPIFGAEHADTPALDLLALLSGGSRSSRLNQYCVEKLGLAEQIEAFAYTPAAHGLWGIEARCAPAQQGPLLASIGQEIERLKQIPPEREEVERAKRMSLLQQVHSKKTMAGKAASLGSGWLYQRDPSFSNRYHQMLQAVKPEELVQVARRYLIPEHENLVALVPRSAPAPAISSAPPVSAYAAPQLLLVGPERRALYQAQRDLPLLNLRAVMPGGLLGEPRGREGISRLAAKLLTKGTRRHNGEELAREIEQLGGALSGDAGNNSATLTLELLSPDAAAGLELFLEMLTETAPTEAELATEKRKQLSLITAESDYPMAIARDLVRQALYPGHPYAGKTLGTVASVEAITLSDILTYQAERLLTPAVIVAVTGPVPPEEWQERVAAAWELLPRFDTLSPLESWQPVRSGALRVGQKVEKEQAVLQLAFATVPLTHPDHVGLALLDEALSDLGSRLFVRIREELGLAYFVGTSQFLGLAASHFVFYLGTDPQKRQAIETELLAEVARLAEQGISQTELNRARAKMESQDKLNQQNLAHVAYTATLDELFGLGFGYNALRRNRLATISLDEVNAIARRYFASPDYVLATVTPE